MIKKIFNSKFPIRNYQKGMTYVELIVVLSIFSVMSAIVLFNHGEFQARVDIKNLANDVALKIVEAQKSSIFGTFPSLAQQALIVSLSTWKPSYGVYFNPLSDNKSFIFFTDLNSNNLYEGSDCTGECVEKISITKNNYISRLDVYYQDSTTSSLNDLTVSFRRPDSTAFIQSSQIIPPLPSPISYVQITISSPSSAQSTIKLYSSGRVQVN